MKALIIIRNILLIIFTLFIVTMAVCAYIVLPPPGSVVTTLFRMAMQITLKYLVIGLAAVVLIYALFTVFHRRIGSKIVFCCVALMFISLVAFSAQWIRVANTRSQHNNIFYNVIAAGTDRAESNPKLITDINSSDNTYQCQIYTDDKSAYKSTAVIYLNYGGWQIQNTSMGSSVQNFCKKEGYTFVRFAAKQKDSSKVDITLRECCAGLSKLINEQKFDKVYLCGGSAGGHLAFLCACMDKDNEFGAIPISVDGVVALYPCVDPAYSYDYFTQGDRRNESLLDILGDKLYCSIYNGQTGSFAGETKKIDDMVFGDRDDASSLYAKTEVKHFLLKKDIPVLMVQGASDSMIAVDSVRNLSRSLAQAGKPIAYLELPGTEHVFDMMPTAAWNRCEGEMTGFLRMLNGKE